MVAKKIKTHSLLLICIMIIAIGAVVLVACDENNEGNSSTGDVTLDELSIDTLKPLLAFAVNSVEYNSEKCGSFVLANLKHMIEDNYFGAGFQCYLYVFGGDVTDGDSIFYILTYDSEQSAVNAVDTVKNYFHCVEESTEFPVFQDGNKIYLQKDRSYFENIVMKSTFVDGSIPSKQLQFIEHGLNTLKKQSFDEFAISYSNYKTGTDLEISISKGNLHTIYDVEHYNPEHHDADIARKELLIGTLYTEDSSFEIEDGFLYSYFSYIPGFHYTESYDGQNYILASYNSADDNINLSIPDKYKSKPVICIDSGAFANCTGLTSVIIPDSVTSIYKYAFYGCDNLTHITFQGTKTQWQEIKKTSDWYGDSDEHKDLVIHCTDGNLDKDGNEI